MIKNVREKEYVIESSATNTNDIYADCKNFLEEIW